MSIAGLNIGTSALQASMIALETTGQNIANVDNPNYTRQRVKLVNTPGIERPWGQFGQGVAVDQIEQIKDSFIDREIRDQTSEFKKNELVYNSYERLMAIYDEGEGYGLNGQIGEFFNSLHDLAAFPEDVSMRTAVLGQADLLTTQMKFLDGELNQLRQDLDYELRAMIPQVNSLLQEIATYNTDIVKIEAGTDQSASDLRDLRTGAMKELAEYIDIQVTEMDSGAVNINTSGRSLVYAGEYNSLATQLKSNDELVVYEVVMSGSGDVIDFTGGKISGVIEARDTDVTQFRDNLDTLAASLIQEMNKLHCDGQGLDGYSSLTGAQAVNDITAALDSAGLDITPSSGTFDIIIQQPSTGGEQAFTITYDATSDSLTDLATAITAASTRITATANADGTLSIDMDTGYTVMFDDDSGNVLAALGVNAMFTGSDASDIDINADLISSPTLFAAAQSGSDNPGENANILAMSQLRDTNIMNSSTKTFEGYYQGEITRLGSEAQEADVSAQASAVFLDQIQLRRESVSGVSLDEEAANMIKYQQAYQAAARFINVMSDMLNLLVNGLI